MAQSALDGTGGECSVMFHCKISQNRQQPLCSAVRANGTAAPDYISTNGLRFPRLPEVTLLLRHVIRCHSAVPAKVPAPPDGAAATWTFSIRRAVWLETGSPPHLRCSRNLLYGRQLHLLPFGGKTQVHDAFGFAPTLLLSKTCQLIAKGKVINNKHQ